MKRQLAPLKRQQHGVTLIVVLLILVVVTVLGIGAAQIALLGERSTRYDRDYLIASQGAEAALVDAEYDIQGPMPPVAPAANNRIDRFSQVNGNNFFVNGCGTDAVSQGLCKPATAPTPDIWRTVNFTATGATAPTVEFGTYTGRTFDSGNTGIQPFQAPRYIIEAVPDVTPGFELNTRWLYRITAIGFGPRQDIQVVMQTAFRKKTSP